jgi:hypothetical protein
MTIDATAAAPAGTTKRRHEARSAQRGRGAALLATASRTRADR